MNILILVVKLLRKALLRIPKIIDAIKKSNADAVHPGYGFLSENVQFRDEVHNAGKIFIGPPSQAISLMGDKIESKKLLRMLVFL